MMRIVFLASDPKRQGGIQRFNGAVIAAAKKFGATIELVIRENAKSPSEFLWDSLRTIARKKPQEIWCGHIRFAIAGWCASWFGYSYVVFTHGIEVWNLSWFQKIMLKRARRITAASRYTKEKIAEQVPSLKENIVVLGNMVDGSVFVRRDDNEFRMHHALTDAKIMLTVARFDARERYKGYDAVLEVLPELLREFSSLFYILTGSGTDLPRLRAKAEELGVRERVMIIDNASSLSELVAIYNAADVFVMPSEGEGFGIVYVEALACGVPVVAGNKDGSRDALLDGKLGILIDPQDREALRIAIASILNKRAPQQLLDKNLLRETVLQAYGKEAFEKKIQSLIG